jgi:hypothetical protein
MMSIGSRNVRSIISKMLVPTAEGDRGRSGDPPAFRWLSSMATAGRRGSGGCRGWRYDPVDRFERRHDGEIDLQSGDVDFTPEPIQRVRPSMDHWGPVFSHPDFSVAVDRL